MSHAYAAAPTLTTEMHPQPHNSRQTKRTPFSDAIEIGNMFTSQDDRQLPSYKDKPYSQSSTPFTKMRRPIFRRRRVLLTVIVIVGLILWRMSAMQTRNHVVDKDIVTKIFSTQSQAVENTKDAVEMEIVSGGEVPKGKRPKLMREGGRAWVELPDGTKKKLERKGADTVKQNVEKPSTDEELEMELVSGGEVPKGKRPKLMREGGKAWIQMPDGKKQALGGKKAL